MCQKCDDKSEVIENEVTVVTMSNLVGSDIFSDIKQFKTIVAYHKDCMDGLGAATMFYQTMINQNIDPDSIEYYPVQYGELYMPKLCEYQLIIFVDFCPKIAELEILEKENKNVYIFDHHESAMNAVSGIFQKDSKDIKAFFDMHRSGTLIVHDILLAGRGNRLTILDRLKGKRDNTFKLSLLARYISDRDLYTFNIAESREFNEGLRYMVSFLKINSPKEFLAFINNGTKFATKFNKGIRSKIGDFQKDLISLGYQLLDPVEKYVHKLTKISKKANVITIGKSFGKPIELKVLLNSHLISEVGNSIAHDGYPTLQLFMVQEEDSIKIVGSLRSKDNLPAINTIAECFGGGGHRNAAGFEISIDMLSPLLSGKL